MRMSAYYYGFGETGVPEVDVMLSAVACAGKAFHHTDQWSDERPDMEPYEPVHRGTSCVDWIQNAAADAAAEILRLRAEVESLENTIREQGERDQ